MLEFESSGPFHRNWGKSGNALTFVSNALTFVSKNALISVSNLFSYSKRQSYMANLMKDKRKLEKQSKLEQRHLHLAVALFAHG